MSKLAWAKFIEKKRFNFLGERLPPLKPEVPKYVHKTSTISNGKGQTINMPPNHGQIVYHLEEHRFGVVRVWVTYEDGYESWYIHSNDSNKPCLGEGRVINGTWYPDKDKGASDEADPSNNHRNESLTEDEKTDNRNTPFRISQDFFGKRNDGSDLHPLLKGDFLIVETEYEWPELEKFPAYDPGEQQDLFGGVDVRKRKDRPDDGASRRDVKPRRGFFD